MKLPKGHVFHGPDGQGYRAIRDIDARQFIAMARDFEAFGGAPAPASGEVMPEWLRNAIFTEFEAQKHRI